MEQECLLFLKLFLTGIFLGLLYDCLRIWRSVMTNSRFWIDLQDLIYWSGAGLFAFYVIYVENNGQIRVYALAGMAAGALFYYATISRWIVRLFGFLLLLVSYSLFYSQKLFMAEICSLLVAALKQRDFLALTFYELKL